MYRIALIVGFAAAVAFAPAYAQDKSTFCTDAHMKEMDTKLAAMTDASKKKEAEASLKLSKDAMQKADTAECIKHMEAAHKAMGM